LPQDIMLLRFPFEWDVVHSIVVCGFMPLNSKKLCVYERINSRGTKQTRMYDGDREGMCLYELLHKVLPLGC
jgi:hypothetical protein